MPEGAVTRFGKGNLQALEASPDSSVVAAAAMGGIYLVDPLSGRTVDFIETPGEVSDVVFSPDGKKIIAGFGEDGIAIWGKNSSGSWQEEEPIPHLCGRRIAISPDGAILLAKCFADNDQTLTSWDLTEGKQNFRQTYVNPNPISFGMAFSPVNPGLAAVANSDILRLVDAKSGEIIKTYNEPARNMITDIDFSPDGKLLAISPYSPAVVVLDAETLAEVSRTKHATDVYLLSFIDNETIISFDKDKFVVQKTDGKIVKTSPDVGEPLHAYVPGHNIVASLAYFSVNFISLDTYQEVGRMEGIHPSYWVSQEISGDGNAFKGNINGLPLIWYSYAESPDRYEEKNVANVCSEEGNNNRAHPGAYFLDNAGRFVYMKCEQDHHLYVIELESMDTVLQIPIPIWVQNNTSSHYHPWKDERELQALLYENPLSSNAKYRIEIWELLKSNKIVSFDVDVAEAQKGPGYLGYPVIHFSPGSKFLAVEDERKKQLLIFDTVSGNLAETIPFEWGVDRLYFSEDDQLIFTSRTGSIKSYSLTSGELLQTYSGIPKGEAQGLAYFPSNETLVWYYIQGKYAFFNIFDQASGEKVASHTTELPTSRKKGTMIYLPPGGQGEFAVIANPGDYYFVDLSTGKITKTYHRLSDNRLSEPLSIGNYLFADEDPVFLKYDLMAGE